MLMLAVNSDVTPSVMSMEAIERDLARLEEAGFTHVQWGHDWEGEYIYSPFEMTQLRRIFEKHHLGVKGVHASEGGKRARKIDGKLFFVNRRRNKENRKDYTSPDEYTRLAGVELIKNRVDLASELGTAEIVLHMQLPYEELRESKDAAEEYWGQSLKSFDELMPYCESRHIKIAMENMICTPAQEQVAQFDRLFARYPKEFLGFCFDSGHCALMCPSDTAFFARRYIDRLIFVHLHDNDGVPDDSRSDDIAILRGDRHRIPFTGIVDWNEVTRLIASSTYELPLTLEIDIHSPDEKGRAIELHQAIEAGKKLDAMVARYRSRA
jgi:sugar phosphate isomerase/epimerase